MNRLNLTLACGLYDRTRALYDGSIQPEGIRLNFLPMTPGETFWRMLNNTEFDLSEMSLSSYSILRSRGDTRFIAIPVFSSRTFRHSALYINTKSGIKFASDLKGKRIGVGDYQMTAAVWVRGLLQDEYGIKPGDMKWVVSKAVQEINLPDDIDISRFDTGKPEELLEAGKIDALISVMMPLSLSLRSGNIRRLFPDYQLVEKDYFSRTRVFPIMHTIVINEKIYGQYPWVAISLYKAFIEAKQRCYETIYNTDALTVSLPWLVSEMEETRELMGIDFWDYSIEGSRVTLDTLVRYLYEQGLTQEQLIPDELFVKNISHALDSYLLGTGEKY